MLTQFCPKRVNTTPHPRHRANKAALTQSRNPRKFSHLCEFQTCTDSMRLQLCELKIYVNVVLPRSAFVSRALVRAGVLMCECGCLAVCAKGASTSFPLPPGTTASGLIYVRPFEGLRVIVTFELISTKISTYFTILL